MLGLLLLAPITVTMVPHEVRAEPVSLALATRGLVRDAVPRLAYDLEAAAAWRDGTQPALRLAYATNDELLAATETRDLLTAHALAAEMMREENAFPTKPNEDGAPRVRGCDAAL